MALYRVLLFFLHSQPVIKFAYLLEKTKGIYMTRDIINVQYPTLDHTESVANIGITVKEVTQANGITIADAFSNKNNSLLGFAYPLPSPIK